MSETISSIRNFPYPDHVINVCRPGQKDQCMFLVGDNSDFSCGMFTERSAVIAADNIKRPVNCGGIVDIFRDSPNLLNGQDIEYDDPPFINRQGKLQSIDLIGHLVTFNADWSDWNISFSFKPTYINPIIEITEQGIVFRPRGWGKPSESNVSTTIILPPSNQ